MIIYHIYKKSQAQFTPEQSRIIAFWNEIDSRFKKTESWRGNPTWDFNNGVKISLTNTPRNTYTDELYNPPVKEPHEWITVYVENISSSDRGKGYATLALEELKKIASKYEIILRLWPHKSENKGSLNDKSLKDWYKRHGFGEELSHGMDAYRDFPEQKRLYLERKPKDINRVTMYSAKFNLSKISKNSIEIIANMLRKKYSEESLKSQCLSISRELKQNLINNGYNAIVIQGTFTIDNPGESNYDEWEEKDFNSADAMEEAKLYPLHYWVEVDGIIVDITANQFNDELDGEEMPEIIIGSYSDWPRYTPQKRDWR